MGNLELKEDTRGALDHKHDTGVFPWVFMNRLNLKLAINDGGKRWLNLTPIFRRRIAIRYVIDPLASLLLVQ